MADLVYTPTADRMLTELENDPTQSVTLRRLNDALDRLADDPGDVRVRTRVYQRGPWGFTVRDGDDDWLILWSHDADAGEVIVAYIGPDL